MSHYSKLQTTFKSQSALAKALVAMGFKEKDVEQFEEAVPLLAYTGKESRQKAHIRIKGYGWDHSRERIGGMYNDMGFERLEDGSFSFHCPDYKSSKYNEEWVDQLTMNYAKFVFHETCEKEGFVIDYERLCEDGTFEIEASSIY